MQAADFAPHPQREGSDRYGFVKGSPARTSESACVAELMKMYKTLTSK